MFRSLFAAGNGSMLLPVSSVKSRLPYYNAKLVSKPVSLCFKDLIISLLRHTFSSTASRETPSTRPKRPSPYRLLEPHQVQATSSSLAVAGWNLCPLPHMTNSVTEEIADLQDRRLVRVYHFEPGKKGWRDALNFVARVGEAVEAEDVGLFRSSDGKDSSLGT